MNVLESFSLKGKVALLTGGAGLYGRQIAEALAEAGAAAYIASRNVAELEKVAASLRAEGGDVTALPLDLEDEASIRALVAEIARRSGRLDVLVNNAVTPAPMFAHTPEQMRAEAGPGLILSGGIPATVFGATGSDAEFDDSVKRWLETRLTSARLLMAAGDQVPTDAPLERILRLRELVDTYGRY